MQTIEQSTYSRRLQHGLAIANRHMLELGSALNRPLIQGNPDGTYREVLASELLEEYRQTDWWQKHFED